MLKAKNIICIDHCSADIESIFVPIISAIETFLQKKDNRLQKLKSEK